jgi:hypothetical protein
VSRVAALFLPPGGVDVDVVGTLSGFRINSWRKSVKKSSDTRNKSASLKRCIRQSEKRLMISQHF